MKKNILKVVLYAALACIALLFLTFLIGFLGWVWAKIVGGFVLAGVLWLIQKLRHKDTTDYFILWWGIGLSLLLISLDLFGLFLWKYGVIVFALAVAGVVFGHKTGNPQPGLLPFHSLVFREFFLIKKNPLVHTQRTLL